MGSSARELARMHRVFRRRVEEGGVVRIKGEIYEVSPQLIGMEVLINIKTLECDPVIETTRDRHQYFMAANGFTIEEIRASFAKLDAMP